LDNLYSYPARTGRSGILSQYPSRQVAYLIGEADTGSDNLDTSPEAMYQGANRYERGRIYREHLRQHFGANQLPAHTFATVAGVAHDAFQMITSPPGLEAHFLALPRLTIRPLPGTNLVELSWRSISGFNLQRVDRPLPTASWTSASFVSSGLTNNIRYVTVSLVPSNRFFRLYKP
jgi:hypothetical protein